MPSYTAATASSRALGNATEIKKLKKRCKELEQAISRVASGADRLAGVVEYQLDMIELLVKSSDTRVPVSYLLEKERRKQDEKVQERQGLQGHLSAELR